MRVSYLIGTVPGGMSSFTDDELEELSRLVDIQPTALVGDAPDPLWTVGPGGVSAAAWFIYGLLRQPRALIAAAWDLIRPAWRRPRHVLVALRASMAAAYLSRHVRPELIHAQFGGPAAAAAFVWHRLTGLPFTIRLHAYDVYMPYSWAARVCREAEACTVISEHAQAHIRRAWNQTSVVIRVGLPLESVAIRGDRPHSVPMRLLSVGRLVPKKGHEIVVDAVTQLVAEGSEVELDIIGGGPTSAYLEQLIGESDRVHLRGEFSTSEIRGMYRDYDALVMAFLTTASGDQDGIPVVLMEAALAGLPIVTTGVAGIPELIDAESGFVVPPRAREIAHTVRRLEDNYEPALRRATVARDRVSTLHDIRATSNELGRLWRQLTAVEDANPSPQPDPRRGT